MLGHRIWDELNLYPMARSITFGSKTNSFTLLWLELGLVSWLIGWLLACLLTCLLIVLLGFGLILNLYFYIEFLLLLFILHSDRFHKDIFIEVYQVLWPYLFLALPSFSPLPMIPLYSHRQPSLYFHCTYNILYSWIHLGTTHEKKCNIWLSDLVKRWYLS